MIFVYDAINSKTGESTSGTIESVNRELAIQNLQERDLIISTIKEQSKLSLSGDIKIFQRVSNKDLVILSKQMATLFQAQVSALQVFRLLAIETEKKAIQDALEKIGNDIQGGMSISQALSEHPKIFSKFYVAMVRAGEESGKLDEIFGFLAGYLERSYEVTSKARNALIYPAFVITVFIGVMILMFVFIIPKISVILEESGQDLPIYTRIVMGISSFFVDFWWLMIILLPLLLVGLVFYIRTKDGRAAWSNFRLSLPVIGKLYEKLYLSRISDNMNTMLASGITMTRALEITKEVVDDATYESIMEQALEEVKGGATLSQALSDYDEIPGLLVQMVRVGEESGELGSILDTMAKFYQREVNQAVDTLVGLIEPVMIVVLGAGVGVLLASVLMPIYNIANSF